MELARTLSKEETMPETVVTKPLPKVAITETVPAPAPKRSSKVFNSFQIAQAQFDKVAEYLGLDAATRELLRFPLREYQFCHSSSHG